MWFYYLQNVDRNVGENVTLLRIVISSLLIQIKYSPIVHSEVVINIIQKTLKMSL